MDGRWTWWVASRYLLARRKEKKSILSFLAVLGLSLGVATLITVMAVMNGFQGGTIRLLMDLQSFHIRIDKEAAKNLENDIELLTLIRSQGGVSMVEAYGEIQGLVRSAFSSPLAAQIRGISDTELKFILEDFTGIQLVRGSPGFDEPNGVFIGDYLAQQLGVRVGDTIDLVYLGEGEGGVSEAALVIKGIIRFGNHGFDSTWLLAPRRGSLQAVFDSSTHIGIRLKDPEADHQFLSFLQEKAGITTDLGSWRTYNRSMFGALRVEKLLMGLTVGLMFLVVAVNLFHDLRVSVREKQEDMGVLAAMGAQKRTIRAIFLVQGGMLGIFGGGIGFFLGLVLVFNLDSLYRLLAQGLYSISGQAVLGFMSKLPVELSLTESGLIALGAVMAGFGAAAIATRRLLQRPVAEIVRNG